LLLATLRISYRARKDDETTTWQRLHWLYVAAIQTNLKGAIMKTSKQLLLGATLLAGTCFATAPVWSQGPPQGGGAVGAKPGTASRPGTPVRDPAKMMKIQQALKDKGFDPGPIDGVAGAKTREAIRAFQKANNLHVTAEESIDDETARALGVAE
jgi:Putative peptidoglycan binding domain